MPRSLDIWHVAPLALCNFDCEYCAAATGRADGNLWAFPEGPRVLEQTTKWIASLPYDVRVRLQTIGEPFVSDEFLERAAWLADQPNVTFVELVTNGSLVKRKLLSHFSPKTIKKLSLWITHHHTETVPHKTLEAARFARDSGAFVVVNALAFPDSLPAIRELKDLCSTAKLPFNADPGYNFENAYPNEGWIPVSRLTRSHREFLAISNISDTEFGRVFESQKMTGRPCSAGHDYVFIATNGDVFPCRPYSLKQIQRLGTVLDPAFVPQLREDTYAPCVYREKCICKEDFMHLMSYREAAVRLPTLGGIAAGNRATQPLSPEEPEVRAVPVQAELTGEEWTIKPPHRAATPGLPAAALLALRQCRDPSTMEVHLERATWASRPAGADDSSAAVALVRELRRAGALATDDEIAKALPGSAAPPQVSEWTLGITTRNDPSRLLACVKGLGANVREAGRRASILVLDDSDEAAETANAAALATLQAQLGTAIRIIHVNRASRNRAIHELQRAANVDDVLTHFALADEHAGAARNFMMLAGAGQNILLAEETISATFLRNDGGDELWLSLADESVQTELLRLPETTLSATPVDLLGMHERYLGRPVGSCASAHATTRFKGLDDALIALLFGADEAVVVGTHIGSVRPLDDVDRLQFVERPTRATWADYPSSLSTSTVRSSPQRLSLVQRHHFGRSPIVGLDATRRLPPFFPTCATPDGPYGAVFEAVAGSWFRALLPMTAVLNAGRGDTGPLDDVLASATAPSFPWVLEAVLRKCPRSAEEPRERRWENVARYLLDVGANAEDVMRTLGADWNKALMTRARDLTQLIDATPRAPDIWRTHARARADVLQAAARAVQPEFVIPNARQLGSLFVAYGRLMRAWPALLDHASRVHSSISGPRKTATNA